MLLQFKKFSKHSSNKALNFLLMTNGLVLISGAMLGPIYALFVEDLGYDILDISMASAVYALTAGITVLISGRFADTVKRPEYIMFIGYIMIGFAFLGYIFIEQIWAIFILQGLIGLGEAIYSPAFNSLYSQNLDRHKEGQEWSMWEAMSYFVIFTGAIFGGLLVTYFSFTTLFLLMLILTWTSGIAHLIVPKKILH